MLFRCQPGYELHLERELRPLALAMTGHGGGWLQTTPGAAAPTVNRKLETANPTASAPGAAAPNREPRTVNREPSSGGAAAAPADLCFAHTALPSPVEITGESVNALAARIADYFLETARAERFDTPWPLAFDCASGLDGLGRRADAVEKAFTEHLRKRMSRVARLAVPPARLPPPPLNPSTLPPPNPPAIQPPNPSPPQPFTPPARPAPPARPHRGLFVYFTDFQRAHAARDFLSYGQRRMADDPLAPSRSYLKVEEAYGMLGREPAANETVADLGAAPGGWSYSAAKRGARVLAVDNGPLKAGALDNPAITHLLQDAFRFDPVAEQGRPVDWLFCDLVEDPHHVLENILHPWLERRWCQRYIVNLKFGRTDPIALLAEVRARIPAARVRHLYHDREEFTLVG